MYAQKEDYLQRLIRQQTESMKKLEEELSAWDRKMVQRVLIRVSHEFPNL